jgi:hypothetical protein
MKNAVRDDFSDVGLERTDGKDKNNKRDIRIDI